MQAHRGKSGGAADDEPVNRVDEINRMGRALTFSFLGGVGHSLEYALFLSYWEWDK